MNTELWNALEEADQVRENPIPELIEELKAKCDAESQFSNFNRVFRTVMSVPNAEVLQREAREKHRDARKRAKKKNG